LSLATSSDDLLDLAKSRTPADRERLSLAIVDLCDAGDADTPHVQGLLSSIFMSLVVEAERDIRRRLAEKLATAPWAPPALINVLALDEIEIARPIIANSPILKEHDLVRLLVEATLEHQIEVARRPQLPGAAVAAILRQGEPAVMTALASNDTAEVTERDLRQMIGASRRIAALRSPLSRHPGLNAQLAMQLYVWVGQAVRKTLAEQFRLDAAALDQALAETLQEVHDGAHPDPVVAAARDGEREEMERRLIDKLHAAGQLRPGYLVRALREKRLSLFAAALARLGRFDGDHVRRALNAEQPELLALACASVGIDRSVFPSILQMVRELNVGRPSGGVEGARRAAGAFAPAMPQVAGAAFRQAVGA
jgi:uncharacterized protein (DUF2336 family)